MIAAVLAHLTTAGWADHPTARKRRRRQTPAELLGLRGDQIATAAARLARWQARRGIRTL